MRSKTLSGMLSSISVATNPGVIALTVTPTPSCALARAAHLETRLARECLRQAEQPGLGGRIIRLTDGTRLTDHRGDHDDPAAAALEHVRQRGLGKKERPGQVDSDDLVPFVFGHVGHRLVDGDAGVVDQDVQAAVEVDDLLDRSSTVTRTRDIALMDADLGAVTALRQLSEELLRLFGVPAVSRGYRCTLTDQALTDRRTDSTGATRHESNAPTELGSRRRVRPGLADLLNRSRRRHADPLSTHSMYEVILADRNLCDRLFPLGRMRSDSASRRCCPCWSSRPRSGYRGAVADERPGDRSAGPPSRKSLDDFNFDHQPPRQSARRPRSRLRSSHARW